MNHPDPSEDVASIRLLTEGGESVEVTLSGEGIWRGNDPDLVRHLNDWYSPVAESGPARGVFGVQEAELASSLFGGDLTLHGDRPTEDFGDGSRPIH